MPQSFQLREPSASTVTGSPFGVGSNGTPVFECVRLLTGSVDLEKKPTGQKTLLRFCHVSQTKRRVKTNTVSEIIQLVFDDDLRTEDADVFLNKSIRENKQFWEELRSELCFCLYWRNKNRYVESFLHLYRILELISVAVPLVYASRINDFRDALNFIKSLSKNDRDKDLAVLRLFTAELSKNNSLSSLNFDYVFHHCTTKVQSALSTQIEKKILVDKNINGELCDLPGDGVKIQFCSVPSFVVSCRNRLFHNALSNDNFKLDSLDGPESICRTIIDPTLYWFSFTLVEILKTQAARYI